MSSGALSRSALMGYGILALPIAFAGMPIYVMAPDFYATQHGISLTSLGFILLGLRFFDAIQDPLIGNLSDRYVRHTKIIILAASVCLLSGMAALFNPIDEYISAWFVVCMLLTVTAYSALSINLNTLGAVWSGDYHQRTRITAMREAFTLVGLLIAISLPSALQQHMSVNASFNWLVLALACLLFFALFFFNRWFDAHHQNVSVRTLPTQKFWAVITQIKPHTQRFYWVYGVSMLASSIPAILVLFFIRDHLKSEAYTGLFLVLYFLSGALAMPLWQRVSKHYGKHKAWLISMVVAIISFIWAFFLGAGDVWQYALICIASGSALGADLALPPSILADYVDESHSTSWAATQFSLLTLLAKASLAIGSAMVLPLLDSMGFVPAQENSDAALQSLSIAYALIPCVIKVIAALLLYHFFIAQNERGTYETASQNFTVNHRRSHHVE